MFGFFFFLKKGMAGYKKDSTWKLYIYCAIQQREQKTKDPKMFQSVAIWYPSSLSNHQAWRPGWMDGSLFFCGKSSIISRMPFWRFLPLAQFRNQFSAISPDTCSWWDKRNLNTKHSWPILSINPVAIAWIPRTCNRLASSWFGWDINWQIQWIGWGGYLSSCFETSKRSHPINWTRSCCALSVICIPFRWNIFVNTSSRIDQILQGSGTGPLYWLKT